MISDIDPWVRGPFLIATTTGPFGVDGFTYRGLGLHYEASAGWKLTHLGSGHLVVALKGDIKEAKAAATEIAEFSDWDFDGVRGWKDRDPDLPKKISSWMQANKSKHKWRSLAGTELSEEQAAEIVRLRA